MLRQQPQMPPGGGTSTTSAGHDSSSSPGHESCTRANLTVRRPEGITSRNRAALVDSGGVHRRHCTQCQVRPRHAGAHTGCTGWLGQRRKICAGLRAGEPTLEPLQPRSRRVSRGRIVEQRHRAVPVLRHCPGCELRRGRDHHAWLRKAAKSSPRVIRMTESLNHWPAPPFGHVGLMG